MHIIKRFGWVAEILNHPLNASRKKSALLDYFRWNIGRRLLGIEYVMPLAGGAKVLLSERQNYATFAYTCGVWDFSEMMFAIHLLRPEDVFVDIGANVGTYTILASAVAGASSMTFEPVESTYKELLTNLRLNDIAARVESHCCGLGETTSIMRMTSNQGGLNHIVTTDGGRDTVEVPVRRLDDVMGGRACRLIKIDAEGFEMSILRGAGETLLQPRLAGLIVELNGSGFRYGFSDAEVHAEIVSHGFQPHHYDPATRQLTRKATFNANGLNTLYVRDAAAIAPILAGAAKVAVRDFAF